MSLLEVKEAGFGYGRHNVLENINFQMEAGEVICLIGPNGSGKTTLLDCLMGIFPLKKGEILLQGKNINYLLADG